MTRTITLLAAAAFALGTIPAQAQDPTDFSASGDAFIAGAQAFEEGDASETRPQEQAEWAYCAGYWNVWTDAVDDGTVPEGRLEPLSAILQPPSNAFQTLGIFMKLEESIRSTQKSRRAGWKPASSWPRRSRATSFPRRACSVRWGPARSRFRCAGKGESACRSPM